MDCGMRLRRVLLILLFGCALAPLVSTASDQTVTVSVTKMTAYMGSGATGVLVYFSPAKTGLEGCSYGTGDQVWLDFAAQVNPSGRDLYASILAAQMAGHSLVIYTSGCAANTSSVTRK